MRITPWIAAIALTAGMTPAVRAQYGQYDQRDQYNRQNDQQSNDGSWRYGNPSQEWHADRVSALAHEIEATATYIHEQAERNNRRPDQDEENALEQLHQLNDAATHLHEQVQTNSEDYSHTRGDFAELITAYNQTVEALRYIAPRPYVNRGMSRIASDMNAMSRYYGSSYGHLFITGRWSSRSGHSSHDGYNRNNGYGRNDYGRDDGNYRPPVR